MRVLALAAAAVVAFAVGLWAGTSSGQTGGHDWTRFGWDARRSSDSPYGIAASAVPHLTRQQVQLPGTADSSPIYLHDVTVGDGEHDAFFLTTTYGITVAVDAETGAILWKWSPPGYSSWAGSSQITTATPVADPSRAWIYAASPDGMIQKLSVADGHAAWRVSITKLPSREKIAAALNWAGGHVIATTGGYIGDAPPYQGHVAVISPDGQLLHVWNSLCSDRTGLIEPHSCRSSDSAIWGRAGAVVVPGSGNLLVATGNGPWNGTTDWGDATLELAPDASRMLGNYTPTNTDELNQNDTDIGSTSPVYLTPTLIAQGGKDGKIRLLSLARLKGTTAHKGGEMQIVSTPSGSDLFTAPAVWRSGGQTVLVASDNGATQAWTLRGGRLHYRWRRGEAGTSPVIAGDLVWVYAPGGALNVFRVATGKLVASLQAGPGHWNSPIVADGRVALPEGSANDHATTGVLDIWR
jgi:hypothetical protein